MNKSYLSCFHIIGTVDQNLDTKTKVIVFQLMTFHGKLLLEEAFDLDSLGDDNDLCVEVLLDYLRVSQKFLNHSITIFKDEHKAKYQKDLPNGWQCESISRHVPHQEKFDKVGWFIKILVQMSN